MSLVFDNVTYFSLLKIYEITLENEIVLNQASNYYPQGNGLVESTKKNIIRIIKKTIFYERRNWNKALTIVLWVYHVTLKPSLNTSSYFLVYVKKLSCPQTYIL